MQALHTLGQANNGDMRNARAHARAYTNTHTHTHTCLHTHTHTHTHTVRKKFIKVSGHKPHAAMKMSLLTDLFFARLVGCVHSARRPPSAAGSIKVVGPHKSASHDTVMDCFTIL
jgi:hypothetical protein